MPVIWNFISSIARSEPRAAAEGIHVDGLDWPLHLVAHPRARRLRLKLDDKGGRLLLTVPRGVAKQAALEWALGQRDWANRQVARLPAPLRCVPGARIALDGQSVRLDYDPDGPRTPRRIGDSLICGGPLDHFERRIGRWLLREARRRLDEEVGALAAANGIRVASVGVGDADSRWGSCSSDGRLRFNWRLLMAPAEVRRFVVAHELAHRLHMDHSPKFHAEEARIFGADPAAARRQLRRLSPELRRVRIAR